MLIILTKILAKIVVVNLTNISVVIGAKCFAKIPIVILALNLTNIPVVIVKRILRFLEKILGNPHKL